MSLRELLEIARGDGGPRPVLVGELNPYGNDPGFALWPEPRGAAGDRLARILGLSDEDYLRRFERANLCTGSWDREVARRHLLALMLEHDKIVLLGRKVAGALEKSNVGPAFTARSVEVLGKRWRFVFLPHPSGRCLEWNRPGARDRARELLRAEGIL